ncbi:MAG: hypothetical protein WCL56_11590 [Sediminibacterium sp.]|jgi:hypothetical protein
MKFRTIIEANDEFIILTEDGGIVAVHNNGENLVSTYYQNRLDSVSNPDDLWEELGSGKAYCNDWDNESVQHIVKDALNWMVVPAPDKWVEDDSLWLNLFPA